MRKPGTLPEAHTALRPVMLIMIALVGIAEILPLASVKYLPLHDYPFHLARIYVTYSLAENQFLGEHFQPGSLLVPNAAFDVVMLGLAKIFPVAVAGHVFVGLTILLLFGGTVLINYALFRRLSVWSVAGGLFAYNWIVLYGFLNYLFGVGLMLCGVGVWIMMRQTAALARIATGTAFALIILWCHLAAFGIFAVVVGGYELQDAVRTMHQRPLRAARALAVGFVPFAIAIACFVFLSPTASEAQRLVAYAGWWGWKPLVLYRTLLSGDAGADLALGIVIAAAAALILWRGRMEIAIGIVAPLVLLAVTFAAMPFALFGAEHADSRLPIAGLFIALASVRVDFLERWARILLGAVLVAGVIVRVSIISADWVHSDRILAAVIGSFVRLPPGATLFSATAGPYPELGYRKPDELQYWHPPLKHVASFAVLRGDIFVPEMWAVKVSNPIRPMPRDAAARAVQPAWGPIKIRNGSELTDLIERIRGLPRDATPKATFLLLLYPEMLTDPAVPAARVVASGEHFALIALTSANATTVR